ncbi:MAG TPA: ABC transporter ATP-binding protein [Desulfomicrobiaceae bacterium]|nr:ABC transporter ATP-binding protein [Desulfomicrobiaceae bacterium]
MPDTNNTSPPPVILDQVGFAYQDKPVLENVSVTFPAGQWSCLLGPSGCGKSTLLRLVSGSLRGRGTICFGDSDTARGMVAWMAQDDLLLPWLSVLDNVCFGARLRGELTPGIRHKALGMLERAGLEGRAEVLPSALSGGMRQRVALLRTLMEDRPVLLMDEPFSRLDSLTRLRLQDLAATMVPAATVLLVTHDPLEALRLGHRIHVMNGDRGSFGSPLIPDGPPPRDPADPDMLRHQATLMAMLRRGESA